MAINFPDSPSVNDTVTQGDLTWIWDGTVWKLTVATALAPAGSDTQVQYNNNSSFAGTSSVVITAAGYLQVGAGTDSSLDANINWPLRFNFNGYTGGIGGGGAEFVPHLAKIDPVFKEEFEQFAAWSAKNNPQGKQEDKPKKEKKDKKDGGKKKKK